MNCSALPAVFKTILRAAGVLSLAASAQAQINAADCLLRPLQDTNLASPTKVLIQRVRVNLGQRVAQGQTLIELDSSTVEARLARVAVEQAFNARALKRSEAVGNLLSEKERDELQTAVKRNEAEMRELEAEIKQHMVFAPHSGVVTDIKVRPGEMNHDDAILRLSNVDELRAELNLPSGTHSRYKTGQKLKITGENGVTRSGRVSFVDPLIDPASQTFRLHVEIPNQDHALTAGMLCRL